MSSSSEPYRGRVQAQGDDIQQEGKQAFRKAERFVTNASEQGGVTPEAQPHSFQDSKRKTKNARVDIEIRSGLTFIPSPQTE